MGEIVGGLRDFPPGAGRVVAMALEACFLARREQHIAASIKSILSILSIEAQGPGSCAENRTFPE